MSYFINHHPHVLAELLKKIHDVPRLTRRKQTDPLHDIQTPAVQPLSEPTVKVRRLSRLLFWIRSVSLTKKLIAGAVFVVAPTAVMTGMFMSPQSVSFSFAGDSCFTNPSLFPATHTETTGDTFMLEQQPSASFGSTPLFSKKNLRIHTQST